MSNCGEILLLAGSIILDAMPNKMGDFWKTLLGGIISGCFSFAIAWYVFHTENEKVIIKQRHEIAFNHLIPKLYTPLLKMLNEYETITGAGRCYKFDFNGIIKILEENTCWLLFVPDDIQESLRSIREVCLSPTNQQDPNLQDELVAKTLKELRNNLIKSFGNYVLRG